MSSTVVVAQPPVARLIKADSGEFYELFGDIAQTVVSGADTEGRLAIGQLMVTEGVGPPPHVHPQHEFFYVLEGELEFFSCVDGVWQGRRGGPGTAVFSPGGAPHCFKGVSPRAKFLGIVWDASLEGLFTEYGIRRDGWDFSHAFDESRLPRLIEGARKYQVELIDPTHPPAGPPVCITDPGEAQPRFMLNEVLYLLLRGSMGRGTTVVDVIQRPGPGAPLHRHAAPEALHVIDGEFEFDTVADGRLVTLHGAAGDTLFIPPWAPHNFRNARTWPSQLLAVLHPDGPGAMEGFFDAATVPVASAAEVLSAPAAPTPEQIAALLDNMQRFGMELCAAGE